MKRNKAAVRRQRHAKRLHDLIESFRKDWGATRDPRASPLDDWTFLQGRLVDITGMLLWPSRHNYPARFGTSALHAPVVVRISRMTLAVEPLPIAISIAARGRRYDQMAAEYAEARSRIKHGDLL